MGLQQATVQCIEIVCSMSLSFCFRSKCSTELCRWSSQSDFPCCLHPKSSALPCVTCSATAGSVTEVELSNSGLAEVHTYCRHLLAYKFSLVRSCGPIPVGLKPSQLLNFEKLGFFSKMQLSHSVFSFMALTIFITPIRFCLSNCPITASLCSLS